jgi:hypothetical protein
MNRKSGVKNRFNQVIVVVYSRVITISRKIESSFIVIGLFMGKKSPSNEGLK